MEAPKARGPSTQTNFYCGLTANKMKTATETFCDGNELTRTIKSKIH